MQLFNLILFWIFFGFLTSYFARKRGLRGKYWFFVGLFLGIIGVIIALVFPKRAPKKQLKPLITIEPLPPIPQEKWYYFDAAKTQQGPITSLRDVWETGHIGEETFVWKEGMENWKRLKALPEVLETLPARLNNAWDKSTTSQFSEAKTGDSELS